MDGEPRPSHGMKVPFARKLEAGEFAVALEITPPQHALPRVLLRRARLLGDAAQAINVIQRPGRQSSLAASLELKAHGLEPAWHLVTRGRTRAEIDADMASARAGGIGQVLCILGDHAPDAGVESPTIREVVAMAREHLPGAIAGATLNQYVGGQGAVLRNLFPKLAAGATYIQAQPVFEAGPLERAAEAIEREFPDARLVAMVMPLLALDAATRIEGRLGIELPGDLKRVLASGDLEAAWGYFERVVRGLVESPLVDGVAVMTFEMDAPAETGERIAAALRRSGAV